MIKIVKKKEIVFNRTNKNLQEIIKKTFGTLKLKKPTQQVMDEIDKEGHEDA